MCAGFSAGAGNAHRLIDRSTDDAVFIEIGDRSAGDEAHYPDDDIKATLVDGQWSFKRKNDQPFD